MEPDPRHIPEILSLSDRPSGRPEQIWDIDLTNTHALAFSGRAVTHEGDVKFIIDDHPVSDFELTMSFGPKFTEDLKNAHSEEDQLAIVVRITEEAEASTISLWERHRLEATRKLEIETDQIRELKTYASSVADRVTLLEESMPRDEMRQRVIRKLENLSLSQIFDLGETFLERAWSDQTFFKRFREFGITLDNLLEIERESREAQLGLHDPRRDGVVPHSAIAMALEDGGLCHHFNELIYNRGLDAVDQVIRQQKLRDKGAARIKYLAAVGIFALGIAPSYLTQFSISGVSGVISALLLISGLDQSAKAVRGMKTDPDIIATYAQLATRTQAQCDSESLPVEASLLTETPLGRIVRNHHKIIESGAAIDALSLFGIPYSEIAALMPASRYDGVASRNQDLRALLWKQCDKWGIATLGQFRTVYRALHARRQLETRIERALFANLAADVVVKAEY